MPAAANQLQYFIRDPKVRKRSNYKL